MIMEQMDFSIEVSESEIEKFADYLYQKENAKATINKYIADIKKFLSFLADDKRINKKVLLQYKEWLAQKYAVNSVNSMLAALNQFLEFLNVGNLKVKRIKVQKQPFLQDQKELTEKECRKLIATAMAEGKEQLALCIETIACTGIRISEIKYFTVERVKSGKIEIYNKGKYRRIFLPKILQKKLLSYCHNNQIAEGWIFVTKNGKLKDRSNIWREMKRLKEKAGVAESKIFPHNFRHLFARIYYKVTKDITENWKNVNIDALPYLQAMYKINTINDSYVFESGKDIVLYFLENAKYWRGLKAKELKQELKTLLK